MVKKIIVPLIVLLAFLGGALAASLGGPITQEMIREASKLLGIQIRDNHTDAMKRGLELNRNAFQEIREFELQNHISPALVFRPFPIGFVAPPPHQPIAWHIPRNVPLPNNLAVSGYATTWGASLFKDQYVEFGRVSRSGAMVLSWSMDKIGPIARNATDCAIVLEAIMGADPADPASINAAFNIPKTKNIKNLRIGYICEFFEQDYPGRANDQQVLDDLRNMGFTLHEVQWNLPFPVAALRIILTAEAAAAFDQLTISGKDSLLVSQGPNAWPNIFRTSRFIPAVEYINANRIRSILIEQVSAWQQATQHEDKRPPLFQ